MTVEFYWSDGTWDCEKCYSQFTLSGESDNKNFGKAASGLAMEIIGYVTCPVCKYTTRVLKNEVLRNKKSKS